MRRGWWIVALLGASLAWAQQDPTAGMVDEDEDVLPRTEYVFNPIQARQDVKVGRFYQKKKNYRAAAARYLEATRWDPTFAEAFWRLAEARKELGQNAQAIDAYRGYLELESAGKQADKAREALTALEAQRENTPLAAGSPE